MLPLFYTYIFSYSVFAAVKVSTETNRARGTKVNRDIAADHATEVARSGAANRAIAVSRNRRARNRDTAADRAVIASRRRRRRVAVAPNDAADLAIEVTRSAVGRAIVPGPKRSITANRVNLAVAVRAANVGRSRLLPFRYQEDGSHTLRIRATVKHHRLDRKLTDFVDI